MLARRSICIETFTIELLVYSQFVKYLKMNNILYKINNVVDVPVHSNKLTGLVQRDEFVYSFYQTDCNVSKNI